MKNLEKVPLVWRNKRKSRVTIITAIVSGDGDIILASDSQTTFGTSKLCNAEKITVIEFPGSEAPNSTSDVLVAQSGLSELSGRVIEIFREKARVQRIEDRFTVSKVAEESVREMRQQLMSLYKDQKVTQDEWERYFRDDNGFELLVGHWFGEKPYLFSVNIAWCVATPINCAYHAIGCGSNLGNYLLGELVTPRMPWRAAIVTALYVVEKVKQYDAFCGGPPKVGFLDEMFGGRLYDENEIQNLVQDVNALDSATKADRNKHLQLLLSKTGERSIPDDKKK